MLNISVIKAIRCHKVSLHRNLMTIQIAKYVTIHYLIVIVCVRIVKNVTNVNVHCLMQQLEDEKLEQVLNYERFCSQIYLHRAKQLMPSFQEFKLYRKLQCYTTKGSTGLQPNLSASSCFALP